MNNVILYMIVSVVLMGLAVYFIVKGMTSKPDQMKKTTQFIVHFKANCYENEMGNLIESIYAKKMSSTAIVALSIVFLAVEITAYLKTFQLQFLIYIFPTIIFGTLQYAHKATLRIDIYDYGMINKSIWKSKSYFFDQDMILESYNVVNSFHKGVSYGYRLRKEKKIMYRWNSKDFNDLDAIERIVTNNHRAVESIEYYKIG